MDMSSSLDPPGMTTTRLGSKATAHAPKPHGTQFTKLHDIHGWEKYPPVPSSTWVCVVVTATTILAYTIVLAYQLYTQWRERESGANSAHMQGEASLSLPNKTEEVTKELLPTTTAKGSGYAYGSGWGVSSGSGGGGGSGGGDDVGGSIKNPDVVGSKPRLHLFDNCRYALGVNIAILHFYTTFVENFGDEKNEARWHNKLWHLLETVTLPWFFIMSGVNSASYQVGLALVSRSIGSIGFVGSVGSTITMFHLTNMTHRSEQPFLQSKHQSMTASTCNQADTRESVQPYYQGTPEKVRTLVVYIAAPFVLITFAWWGLLKFTNPVDP